MQLLTPSRRRVNEAGDQARPSGSGLSAAATTKAVLAAALGPLVAGYAAVAALLALITSIDSVATFSVSGVLRAAAPGWLAAYQVPITILARPLGVLPLLVTAGVCLLIAHSAAHAAERLGYREPGQAVNLIAPMAAAHSLLGVVIAFLSTGTSVSVEPLRAFLIPGLVAAVSATVGLARPCGIVETARKNLDPVAIRGLRAGALGMAGLLAVGALIITLSLVFSVPTIGHLFATSAPGFGSGLGMLLLSIGYLPNAVVGALSFAAGPGFSIGSVSAGAFFYTGGVVPGVPLLAGVPEHAAHWWPLLMVLPAAVGALVGWSLRNSDDDPRRRLRMVAIAGTLVGFGCVLLCTVAGGQLGSGPFNPVAIPVGLMPVTAFGWIAIPGGLVAWLTGPRARPAEVPAQPGDDEIGESPEPEDEDSPVPEEDDSPDEDDSLAPEESDRPEPGEDDDPEPPPADDILAEDPQAADQGEEPPPTSPHSGEPG